jgi:hypothetical protein
VRIKAALCAGRNVYDFERLQDCLDEVAERKEKGGWLLEDISVDVWTVAGDSRYRVN